MELEQYFRREPIADRGISVVLPAYNATECLEAAIASVRNAMTRLERGHEIIVVDDGSTDTTAHVVQQLATSNRRLRLVQHASRQGYGAALRAGFQAAKYPLVLQLDPGHHYLAAETDRLLDAIDRVDIVCSYREGRPRSVGQRLLDWLHTRLMRIVFAVHVHDVECGFKLFRRAALRRIPIQSTGRFASAEILAKANFMNMLVDEVAVSFQPSVCGTDRRLREPTRATIREACRVFWRPQFTTDPGHSGRASSGAAEAA